MPKLKYDVLLRNGKERFLIIPEKEFEEMRERLEDDADFRAIEESKRQNVNGPRFTLEQIKNELGGNSADRTPRRVKSVKRSIPKRS